MQANTANTTNQTTQPASQPHATDQHNQPTNRECGWSVGLCSWSGAFGGLGWRRIKHQQVRKQLGTQLNVGKGTASQGNSLGPPNTYPSTTGAGAWARTRTLCLLGKIICIIITIGNTRAPPNTHPRAANEPAVQCQSVPHSQRPGIAPSRRRG